MKAKSWVGLLVMILFLVAACGGAVQSPDANLEAGAPAAAGSAGDQTEEGVMLDDTPRDDTSDAEMSSSDDMSDDEMADDDMSSDDTSDDDMADDDISDDDMAGGDTSDDDMSDDDMADDDMSDDGMADDDMSDDDMAGDTSDDAMSGEANGSMMDVPGWFTADLTDVAMGEAFTIAGFEGKVVLVETMAIWCPSCLRQQQEVLALHESLGMRDDLVTVVLDIDPNEDAGSLQEYAARHGFDWYYAVAPRAVAREIGQLYGDQFLNPPSTPMLIVDRHGEVHPLPFGLKMARDLEEALTPFLDGEM